MTGAVRIDLSTTLFLFAVLIPFMAFIGVWRFRNRPHWVFWLIGSSIFGYLLLIGGDSAYYDSVNAEYERTQDPKLSERITNDAGSGMFLVTGPVLSLIWNLLIFGLFAIIRATTRRLSRCRQRCLSPS